MARALEVLAEVADVDEDIVARRAGFGVGGGGSGRVLDLSVGCHVISHSVTSSARRGCASAKPQRQTIRPLSRALIPWLASTPGLPDAVAL